MTLHVVFLLCACTCHCLLVVCHDLLAWLLVGWLLVVVIVVAHVVHVVAVDVIVHCLHLCFAIDEPNKGPDWNYPTFRQ